MALVLAGAGVDQDGVARGADDKSLVGDRPSSPSAASNTSGSIAGQMMLEDGLVIGREEILRPPPRAFALDHRVDGDVADPELLHRFRLRRDLLQQRHQRLRRGDVGRMAGVDLVIAPGRISFGHFRKLPKRVRRRDAGGVDVAARQGQRAALQLEGGLEAFDRHVHAALAQPLRWSAGDVSGGVGFGGTRQPRRCS